MELAELQDEEVGDGTTSVVIVASELLRRANDQLKSFPRWIRVRRVIPTRDTWNVDNGLLTPTMKLKRPIVVSHFKDRIDAAYASTAD